MSGGEKRMQGAQTLSETGLAIDGCKRNRGDEFQVDIRGDLGRAGNKIRGPDKADGGVASKGREGEDGFIGRGGQLMGELEGAWDLGMQGNVIKLLRIREGTRREGG
ncbi:hypothetical protein P0Y35_04680 [Kiritimatiellaeota bacterium B1221]|nr:hypothetical protein [Kiritimatiellaeota bacterium B1221]